MAMKNTEYAEMVRWQDPRCPVCESPLYHIDGVAYYGDKGNLYATVMVVRSGVLQLKRSCESCGSEWDEVYKVDGYWDLKEGDKMAWIEKLKGLGPIEVTVEHDFAWIEYRETTSWLEPPSHGLPLERYSFDFTYKIRFKIDVKTQKVVGAWGGIGVYHMNEKIEEDPSLVSMVLSKECMNEMIAKVDEIRAIIGSQIHVTSSGEVRPG